MVLTLLLSLATLAAQADTASDAAVRRTIERHYFAAHASGSGDSLRGVFVDEGRMFWAADGQLRSRASTEYINGFSGKPAADEAQRRRRILAVDVTGDVAIAKAELDYPEVRLVDYFILVRAGGNWKIVSKAFHRFPKASPGR
ncbi:MAG TPA: nuclear transport factor 2 family protein [Gemmatimonadales bacterium]|nr:nuclear transport factor 2 family protein [Gemmatimonadales bacterium]